MAVQEKYQAFTHVFTLCGRVGSGTAVAIGGAVMGKYWEVASLPGATLVSVLGIVIIVGAFVLISGAAAMFAIDVSGQEAGFSKRVSVAVPVSLITVLYAIGVIAAGIHAIVR
ncbi:MAG: hypothetical protein WBG85_10140 [Rhodanobacter sp.]